MKIGLVNKSRGAVRRAIAKHKQERSAYQSTLKKKAKLDDQSVVIMELLEKNLSAVRIHECILSPDVCVP